MKLILICGPWSSGTTAVAGMLHKLGIKSPTPFWRTNDEKTKNSFESVEFRKLLISLISEEALKKKNVKSSQIIEELKKFNSTLQTKKDLNSDANNKESYLFLKHPLSAFIIPEIATVFDLRLIYILRPIKDIEKTRQRRSWPEQYGMKGAKVIYSKMFSTMIEYQIPTLIIRYPDLLKRPLHYSKQLARFSGVPESADAVNTATEFITTHS